MSKPKDPNMEIEALSDDDLESVSGGATETTGGTCVTSAGFCSTSLGAICRTSGSGTCINERTEVEPIDPGQA